jgi:hypothetical protein
MLLPLLVLLQVDPTPEPDDVKAGPVALVIFLALIAAVVFLGFSLVKQLRKAQAAKDAGVYGDGNGDTETDTGTGADEREDRGHHSS